MKNNQEFLNFCLYFSKNYINFINFSLEKLINTLTLTMKNLKKRLAFCRRIVLRLDLKIIIICENA